MVESAPAPSGVWIDGGRRFCQPTYVDDAVEGMLACLRRGRPGAAYHLVGPRPVSFRELGAAIAAALRVSPPRASLPRWSAMLAAGGLELVGRACGMRAPLTRSGVAFFSEDRVVSCTKARDELGYAPAHDIADGAARYANSSASPALWRMTAPNLSPRQLGFDVNVAGCSIGAPASYYGMQNYGNGPKRSPSAVPRTMPITWHSSFSSANWN